LKEIQKEKRTREEEELKNMKREADVWKQIYQQEKGYEEMERERHW